MVADRDGVLSSGPRHPYGIRSNDQALSPNIQGVQMSEFNINDYNNEFDNQDFNEEVKKLLLEN